ncbi:MAG TPA: transglutaminase family protein [Chthoniobacteraceae bacterium]|nr:transglutaminase family protein [Chthoniobacteraceae bacterium]
MSIANILEPVADQAARVFEKHGVRLTLGGEPTYVPINPEGPEWTVTALGPTKLRYAYTLSDTLKEQALPTALDFYCPGKMYPGELNPRWAITLVWRRDGGPLVPALADPLPGGPIDVTALDGFRSALVSKLGVNGRWMRGVDPLDSERQAWVLSLDYADGAFVTEDWELGDELELLRTDGPAGLRLPLHLLPPDLSRRAITIEVQQDTILIFLPPLIQQGFLSLLENCTLALHETRPGPIRIAGYIPGDEGDLWNKLGLASDPGVLEINLPPCLTWQDYRHWLEVLEKATASSGLRSYKQVNEDEQLGTGGGNHLLFGGPSLDDHPFFSRPGWVTSILRYWQQHPSLAYLFTGQYVGASSQAPRPDEGAAAQYDLEMAYQFLEQLGPGDHRHLISETLRHLHTDGGGNTHRSESSFDKFWNVNFDGGCRGLIEFRAIESLPRAEWMSSIALLWYTMAAWLLDEPCRAPIREHGNSLHDHYFLPAGLIHDFTEVLADLGNSGYHIPASVFTEIIAWRLPVLLQTPSGLIIRRALEGWPLLCETPLEGGSTSRFVDTSIERLEFTVPPTFTSQIQVQGRPLPVTDLPGGNRGAGLRYRRTALYPSLHPGIPVQLPLYVSVEGEPNGWRLDANRHVFVECDRSELPAGGTTCKKLRPDLLTFDLRLA